jgi:hypothetical protein
MARVQRRFRWDYQAGNAGATQASQEKQDDGVSQSTPSGGNHQDAHVNLDTHARDAHDNDDNPDCAENHNSDIVATTNGDDRPDVHGHEGEDIDDDKKEGQAGDQPQTQASQEKQDDGVSQGLPPQENHEDVDANPDPHAHDAHDNNVHSDSAKNDNSDIALATDGWDRPELHNHEGHACDQLPEEDGNNDRDVPFDDNKNVYGNNNVEDDNNDGDDAVPLATNISPQFDSSDIYKVLGVPLNATERQIKSAYFNLAKKHHPDRQPIHLSKDDANRSFLLLIMPMRYWATRRKEGYMMHLCPLVK